MIVFTIDRLLKIICPKSNEIQSSLIYNYGLTVDA